MLAHTPRQAARVATHLLRAARHERFVVRGRRFGDADFCALAP
jgi:hypothetical protein